jgi:hypothetical protein
MWQLKVDHEELMVANAKSDWHHTGVCRCQIAGGPNDINWFASLKICHSELPSCEVTSPSYLDHQSPLIATQTPPNKYFVGVDAQDKMFTLLAPSLHVAEEILL